MNCAHPAQLRSWATSSWEVIQWIKTPWLALLLAKHSMWSLITRIDLKIRVVVFFFFFPLKIASVVACYSERVKMSFQPWFKKGNLVSLFMRTVEKLVLVLLRFYKTSVGHCKVILGILKSESAGNSKPKSRIRNYWDFFK